MTHNIKHISGEWIDTLELKKPKILHLALFQITCDILQKYQRYFSFTTQLNKVSCLKNKNKNQNMLLKWYFAQIKNNHAMIVSSCKNITNIIIG